MLIERLPENPLITCADVKPSRHDFDVVGAFNPAAVKFKDRILLLLRVAERPAKIAPGCSAAPVFNPETGRIDIFTVKHSDPDFRPGDSRIFYYKNRMYLTSLSHLRLARSTDGVNFTVDPAPTVFPADPTETFGIEDPRITPLEDRFYITAKAVSPRGICTILIETCDFKTFRRHGIIFCPENLDVVLFPERIRGYYYALTRPVPANLGPRAIWLARSPDLIHWGGHKLLLEPVPGRFDSTKVGAGCPPIKTPRGWLEIFHAADDADTYRAAACLLDLEEPSRIIARTTRPLMQPETDYETSGFYPDVVFPTGAVTDSSGTVTIYYGAADSAVAAARTTIDELLTRLT